MKKTVVAYKPLPPDVLDYLRAHVEVVQVDAAEPGALAAALKKMHDNYASFANFTPGPQDIFDYNIGNLWLKGIDGSGTTVAVIEGWDDPNVAAFIHTTDLRYGLPDPVIQTIYPSGPLPAQCPPGMVALGSYGSCDAWQGELELDVLTVHLIAPYAKIIISATPADSEITDDAASNVAPPEMMHALEYISANHIANAISISDGTGEDTYAFGTAQIHANDPGPLAAAAAGIPVLNATGDCGVVQNLAIANAQDGIMTQEDYARFSEPFDRLVLAAASGAPLNILHLHGDKVYLDRFVKGWPAAALNYSNFGTGRTVAAMRAQYSGVLMSGLDEKNFRQLSEADLRKQWEAARDAAGNISTQYSEIRRFQRAGSAAWFGKHHHERIGAVRLRQRLHPDTAGDDPGRHQLHVIRGHKVATAQACSHAGCPDQRQRAPR